MDTNSNQASGMSLPRPAGGQGAAASVPQAQGYATSSAALPLTVAEEAASDEELDQEWVNKAKEVVEQTKGDPFAQSNALNKIKAEYLKARFNKDFNVGGKPST